MLSSRLLQENKEQAVASDSREHGPTESVKLGSSLRSNAVQNHRDDGRDTL